MTVSLPRRSLSAKTVIAALLFVAVYAGAMTLLLAPRDLFRAEPAAMAQPVN